MATKTKTRPKTKDELAEELAAEVLELRELEKEVKETRAKVEDELLALLGLSRDKAGKKKAGRYTVRVRITHPENIDVTRLRLEEPKIAEKYTVEGIRRAIVIK